MVSWWYPGILGFGDACALELTVMLSLLYLNKTFIILCPAVFELIISVILYYKMEIMERKCLSMFLDSHPQ